MYRAKAGGRDRVAAFTEDAGRVGRSAADLERTAPGLERGEIVPYFQPIVDLDGGHVVSFEVLVRWLHPDAGCSSRPSSCRPPRSRG